MALLNGYFDESLRPDGTFTVAGCLFDATGERKFKRQWGALFAPYAGGCHMKDLVGRREAFDGISDSENKSLMERAVAILNHRITLMAWLTCAAAEGAEVFGTKGDRSAYFVCCARTVTAMAGYCLYHRPAEDRVMYVFEDGRQGRAEVEAFLQKIASSEGLRTDFRYAGHMFVSKGISLSLQAADFAAWEWGKFKVETMDLARSGDARPPRESFRQLIQGVRRRGFVYRKDMTQPDLIAFREWLPAFHAHTDA